MMVSETMDHPLRFARLGFCRLRCPDLARSVVFYRDMVGLEVASEDGLIARLRCSDKPFDLVLEKGAFPGFTETGFELESGAELDKAFTMLAALGLAPQWTDPEGCQALAAASAFQFTDPASGLATTFYHSQTPAQSPYQPHLAKIARLGHVVINVTDPGAAHRFWVDQLGFVRSDNVEGVVEWLRAWPNPLHHSLGLVASNANSLHHINFMVTDIDDIGRAMNRLKDAGVPIVYGPGRHLPSTSIFLYFLDPDGNTAELSFGMELFLEHGARDPRELEHKAEVMDIWGSKPDPRFGKGSPIMPLYG